MIRFSTTRQILRAAPLILLALFLLGHFLRWGSLEPQAPIYNHGHFLFDWREWGFVKRGLIATLLPQTVETVGGFAAWFSAILGAGVLAASAVLLRLTREPAAMLVVMASPFFVYTLGYDLGKLDVVGILWFLIWLILREAGWQRGAFALYGLSPLLLFVHEGFLLFLLPVFALVQNAQGIEWRANLVFGALALASFAVIWIHGGAPEHAARLDQVFEGHFGAGYLAHDVLTAGFSDNLALAWEKHLDPPNGHSALTLMVFAGIAGLYAAIFQLRNRWIYGATVVSFGAMFALGSDWARWTALFASLAGIGLCHAAKLPEGAARWIERLLIPALLVSICLMPAGMVFLFQELESLLRNGHLTQW